MKKITISNRVCVLMLRHLKPKGKMILSISTGKVSAGPRKNLHNQTDRLSKA